MFLKPTEVMYSFQKVWFFFFSSFVSSVEEKFAVVFDSWTRRDCNLISFSVFSTLAASWISNILDGWLPKNVSCQAPVRFLEVREQLLFSCDFSIILFLKSELWFVFLSKAYFFHNLSWEEKVAQFLSVFNLRWGISSRSVVSFMVPLWYYDEFYFY